MFFASHTRPSITEAAHSTKFAAVLVAAAAFWFFAGPSHSRDAVVSIAESGQAQALGQTLVSLNSQYRGASVAERRRLENSLVSTAKARLDILASLMDTDPGEVLAATLPASTRSQLPSSLTPYLEQDA